MTDYWLQPHPDAPARSVENVSAALRPTTRGLDLIYVVKGPATALVIPSPAKPDRTDELWRTTCMELFLLVGEQEYFEFNFSPSRQWAAYRFDSRRSGMAPLELEARPQIRASDEGDALRVIVQVEVPPAAIEAIGLTAVVEEIDGTKSYWALAHAPGPPDFHNPDCFIAMLPAPDAT